MKEPPYVEHKTSHDIVFVEATTCDESWSLDIYFVLALRKGAEV